MRCSAAMRRQHNVPIFVMCNSRITDNAAASRIASMIQVNVKKTDTSALESDDAGERPALLLLQLQSL